jgi:hypothetical protein
MRPSLSFLLLFFRSSVLPFFHSFSYSSLVIVRREPDALVLITQPDHAAAAATILEHWLADGLPAHPQRDRIIAATRQHDIGWAVEDAAPRVNPDTGLPYDFITMPEDVRQAVWPRGVDALRDTPYEAALVAQHALTIYRRYEGQATFDVFFTQMARARDALFQRCQDTLPDGSLGSFMQAYAWLSIADLLSLIVCHGWKERFDADHYQATLDGDVLRLDPDPFGGREVPFRVAGRRIARRRYESDDDVRDAYAAAPVVWTAGTLTGVR